jgi:hypothetical protein
MFEILSIFVLIYNLMLKIPLLCKMPFEIRKMKHVNAPFGCTTDEIPVLHDVN